MLRHVTCKTIPVQRSRGHSAVGGAAYRAGENITARGVGPNGEDKIFRYSPKAVVVRESFIMTPEGAADWTRDRAKLWNHVEGMETHKNARLGRDINLGLAYELDHDEQRDLVMEFAKREFVDKGFIVDVAIHNYGRTIPAMGGNDQHKEKIREWAEAGLPFVSKAEAEGRSDVHVMEMTNRDGAVTGYKLYQPHAHLRATPRPWGGEDFAKDKYASREMNRHSKAMEWRYEWPKLQNEYLRSAGSDVEVTCTSEAEDQFPDIRFLGRNAKSETQTISQREGELSEDQRAVHEAKVEAKQADEAFRTMHNEALAEAFLDDEEPTQDDEGDPGEARRVSWWQRTAQRVGYWREGISEQADTWRTRLEQQAGRIRGLFDWSGRAPDDGPRREEITHEPNRDEPEL